MTDELLTHMCIPTGTTNFRDAYAYYYLCLKVPCSYYLTTMGTFALLMYMSEFRLRVSSF